MRAQKNLKRCRAFLKTSTLEAWIQKDSASEKTDALVHTEQFQTSKLQFYLSICRVMQLPLSGVVVNPISAAEVLVTFRIRVSLLSFMKV